MPTFNHILRQNFAQRRYRSLTGWECPLNGGKTWKSMTKAERGIDRNNTLFQYLFDRIAGIMKIDADANLFLL
ncbi:MAG: hypothetical protein GY782_02675 [Gammaproteobacteria bacterium]|nr:hypothetical protein [Gammaproteobacteria bacterium]